MTPNPKLTEAIALIRDHDATENARFHAIADALESLESSKAPPPSEADGREGLHFTVGGIDYELAKFSPLGTVAATDADLAAVLGAMGEERRAYVVAPWVGLRGDYIARAKVLRERAEMAEAREREAERKLDELHELMGGAVDHDAAKADDDGPFEPTDRGALRETHPKPHGEDVVLGPHGIAKAWALDGALILDRISELQWRSEKAAHALASERATHRETAEACAKAEDALAFEKAAREVAERRVGELEAGLRVRFGSAPPSAASGDGGEKAMSRPVGPAESETECTPNQCPTAPETSARKSPPITSASTAAARSDAPSGRAAAEDTRTTDTSASTAGTDGGLTESTREPIPSATDGAVKGEEEGAARVFHRLARENLTTDAMALEWAGLSSKGRAAWIAAYRFARSDGKAEREEIIRKAREMATELADHLDTGWTNGDRLLHHDVSLARSLEALLREDD